MFQNFKNIFDDAYLLPINKTYRNSYELIEIAGKFIKRNANQINKRLVSDKSIAKPIKIYFYKNNVDRFKEKAKVINEILEEIDNDSKRRNKKILFLGRYNFDIKNIINTNDFFIDPTDKNKIVSRLFPSLDITFLTVHSAKGLGFDEVIIINCDDDIYGFPSKIVDDDISNLLTPKSDNFYLAEERRLFYVALTRTKTFTHIVTSITNPSIFVKELIKDFKNIDLFNANDSYEENEYHNELMNGRYHCPVCNKEMIYTYCDWAKRKLFICSNEKELCGFRTNDLHGGSTRIRRCNQCNNGYLFIQKNLWDNEYYLVCKNMKSSKNALDKKVSKRYVHYEILDNENEFD